MEVPLSWERLLWSCRPFLGPRERYALTDFRLVRIAGPDSDEIALDDIGDVQRRASWLDRRLGRSTILVHARSKRRPPLVLRDIRKGPQLAALLDLAAGDARTSLDPDVVRAAMAWDPRDDRGIREAFAALAAVGVALFAVAMTLHGKASVVSYPGDDAIYPAGMKRSQADIVRFMERDVMPWARETLGPLKGGAAFITCETCHGADAVAREWRMPAVTALPQSAVLGRGWEVYSAGMDAQMRNAIYGYIAESDNQTKAAYMRELVMPGMARLLKRPAYDFTKPYEYNRTHFAFGCYHCHRVAS